VRGETPRSSSLEAGRGRTNDDCYPIERQERMGDDTQTTPRELEGEGRRRPAQDEETRVRRVWRDRTSLNPAFVEENRER